MENRLLTLAQSAAPDVIIMAGGLPDMDGIEAAREMMRVQPLSTQGRAA